MRPFVVVEGSERDLEMALHAATAAGERLRPGFDPPHDAAVVRSGTVHTPTEAAAAVEAALAGQGLVVRVLAPIEVVDRFIDDLRRLGPVEYRIGQSPTDEGLGTDARAILGLLAEGQTLGEAAAILGLSRRTADRRLAQGRRALGATRTTEAIARGRRLGWLLAPGGPDPHREDAG